MTEEEWAIGIDLPALIFFGLSRLSPRRQILLNCDICDAMARLFLDKQGRRSLAVLERSADESVLTKKLRQSHNWANSSLRQCHPTDRASYFTRCALRNLTIPDPRFRTINGSGNFLRAIDEAGDQGEEARRNVTKAIKDVVGNPFRPVALNPSWLSRNTVR